MTGWVKQAPADPCGIAGLEARNRTDHVLAEADSSICHQQSRRPHWRHSPLSRQNRTIVRHTVLMAASFLDVPTGRWRQRRRDA